MRMKRFDPRPGLAQADAALHKPRKERGMTMRNRMFVGTFALLGVLGFTLPASAFVPAGGSLDCVLFACTSIKFEQGPTKIQGNVCVQQNNPPAAPGFLKTGNNNQIAFPGFKAIAQKVQLASGSQEGTGLFDTTIGANPA